MAEAVDELEALLAGLNPPQVEAVTHGDGPLLVFAGAGSGKTRVLTTRIAYLIASRRAWPDRILAVTFTNKAAREMRERIARLTPEGAAPRWMGTFHSMSVRILRRDGERIGVPPGFVIFDEADSRSAIRRVLSDLGLDPKRYSPASIASAISQYKNELLTPDQVPNRGYADEVARRCYAAYERILRAAGGLDFDDLIGQVVRLLSEDAEALAGWRDRFRHVLVDEFQDTNHAQYTLVHLLAGQHRNLAVVGDDDQSIYGWRGADVRNILDFQQDYPEARVVKLEQNYRSTQPILDVAHSVISHNRDRADKRLWTNRKEGDRVVVHQAYSETEEAEFVADEIRRMLGAGRQPADFAVLYRTNAQSRAFEEVLSRRGIPYQIVGGVKFWERREVKDVLSYLRLVVNPNDWVSFTRIANVPRRKLGEVSVEAVVKAVHGQGRSVLEVLADPASVEGLPRAAQAPLGQLHDELARLVRAAGSMRPSEVVEAVIRRFRLEEHYRDGTLQGDARVENVRELQGYAAEFDELEDGSGLDAFLSEVALINDIDASAGDSGGVTLITLHTVKGLEYPVVFLVGMEDGILPHQRSIETPSGMEEERRLAYVGMTRARDRLYLTHAFRRHLFGRAQASVASRFLKEIPPVLLSRPSGAPPSGYSANLQSTRDALLSRQLAPPAETGPPVPRYTAGMLVEHPRFGRGQVLKSTLTSSDEELMVQFEQAGLRILSGSVAPLRPL